MPDATEVIVIGGGILGSVLAYEFSKRQARVTVIEKDRIGGLATSGSFAWITNQTAFRNAGGLTESRARDYFELHRLSHNAWRRVNDDLDGALALRWTGTMQTATPDTAEDRELQDEWDRRVRWGSPSYWITPARAKELEPNVDLGPDTRILYTEDEGSVDPLSTVALLIQSAKSRGATICEGEEVLSVTRENGKSRVKTSIRDMEADVVVFACGVDNPQLLKSTVDVPLAESSGSIVHLEPIERLINSVLLTSKVHAIQRADGRVVIAQHFSGSPVGDPEVPEPEQLLAVAASVVPGLAGARIEKVTSRRRIVPQDGLPIYYNNVDDGVAAITTNAGISLGPILAQLIVTEILTGVRSNRLDPYRADRFSTV
jgi:glycine/D-amino acid oxidase-like deaminating enzyme